MIAFILKMVLFLLTFGGTVHYAKCQGPSYYVAQTNSGALGDSGLYVYQQFTPTSIHGNRKEFFYIVHDSIGFKSAKMYFDSLVGTHVSNVNPSTLLTLGTGGRLINTNVSAVQLEQSNIKNLSDTFVRNDQYTFAGISGKLGYTPYNAANPNGYISGITGANVVAALGYVPYNSVNPLGFITANSINTLTNKTGNVSMFTNDAAYLTSINSSMIGAALGYTPYNAANPNGYISSYTETDPLFNSNFSGKTTSDLAEGTNQYYTLARFNTAFSAKNTDNLTEGSTNLYSTTARTRSALSGGTGINYNSSTGIITNTLPDQTITISNGTGISVSGTYPSFTVTNSKPGTTFTDLSGAAVSVTKVAMGTVTPSTGNGYSIDISGVGFSNVLGYEIMSVKSTASATSVPKVSVKSVSNTAIVVNIIEGNANTVNILGSLVLLGVSEQFVNTTGLTLNVIVYGN